MKYAVFLIFFALPSLFAGGKPAANSYVGFSVSVKEKSLKPGDMGTLVITLAPKKGIHINLTPPMSIKLDSAGIAALSGTIQAPPQADSATLFDASGKITQKFTVVGSAKSGKATIKGMFVYYFCSDAEGWCNRSKTPFECTVTVRK